MLKLLLLLLTASLFGSLQTRAQTFEPGLLVRSNGDTLRGEIENGFWTEPPTLIRYRSTPDSPIQLFQPRQLRAVSFIGGRYFRYEALSIDHGAETRLDRLPMRSYTNVKIDSVLADVLVEGPVSLFRVVGHPVTHYLVSGRGRPILDMSARLYFSQSNDGSYVKVDGNNYHDQLALYLNDCPAANRRAFQAEFTPAGLAAVVQLYNESCVSAPQPSRSWLAQAVPRRVVAFQAGIIGGLRFNKIEGEMGINSGECTECKVRPFGGIYSEFFLPSRTVALYGELSLSTFRSRAMHYYNLPTQSEQIADAYNYRAWLGTARLGFRYFFPLAQQQVHVGFGFEINTVLKPIVTSAPNPLGPPDLSNLYFAQTTFLPNLDLGWHNKRVTLSLDGQLYTNNAKPGADQGIGSAIVGTNFALRLSMAYRLSRNPDVTKLSAPAKP